MKKLLSLILASCILFSPFASLGEDLIYGKQVVWRGTITGLRISAVNGTAFIDNISSATGLTDKAIVSGSITNTNNIVGKVSAVDGSAFVDFGKADILTQFPGKYIIITDTNGATIAGWIKAAGTSEGYGPELWDAPAAAFTSGTYGWVKGGNDTMENDALNGNPAPSLKITYVDTASNAATDYFRDAKDLSTNLTVGTLYKVVADLQVSGGTFSWSVSTSVSSGVDATTISDAAFTNHIKYFTCTHASNDYIRVTVLGSSASAWVDNMSLKAVTAPGPTGVTIANDATLATQNWAVKTAGFLWRPNTFTYTIYNKEIGCYADGTTQIEFYDASGRFARGALKLVGTAETLDTEIATGTLVANTLYKITATEVNHFGTGLVVGSYFTSAGTETCDANNKVKKVLTPGTSGATIVSTKAGATYNFGYVDPALTKNAASYYVILSKMR